MLRTSLPLLLALAALSCRAEPALLPRDPTIVQALAPGPAGNPPAIERLDPAIHALVPPDAAVIPIAGGYKWTEGPVWLPSNRLHFAEIPSNSIRIWTPGAGVRIFLQPSGYKGAPPYGGPEPGSDGMALDAHQRLTVAGHAQRDVWRLEGPSPQVTLLADT